MGRDAVLDKLVDATNAHDVEAVTACFAADYVNETPVHPSRSFRGNAQVRRNKSSRRLQTSARRFCAAR